MNPLSFYRSFRTALRYQYMTVTHGLVLGNFGAVLDHRYTHAWCEFMHPMQGSSVFDPCVPHNGFMHREFYYDFGKITFVIKYKLQECKNHITQSGHYGPWDKYLKEYRRPIKVDLKRLVMTPWEEFASEARIIRVGGVS